MRENVNKFLRELNEFPTALIEKSEWDPVDGMEPDLPMYGYMWNSKDFAVNEFLETHVELLNNLGFRVFRTPETGVLLGIDAWGYDFSIHWNPLYEVLQEERLVK